MIGAVDAAIQRTIAQATGSDAKIASRNSTGGGCINHSEIVRLVDGRRFFVKSNSQCPADMFQREAQGLAAISGTGTICVPEVIGIGCQDETFFLILEVIDSSRKSNAFFETLGEQLAGMHRISSEEHNGQYGFENDNYLGSTLQPNSWRTDWIEFWREHRLGFQLQLARKNGYFLSLIHI